MEGINLVLISSADCSPCRALKSRLKTDNLDYIELDVNAIDFDKWSVMSVPVFMLMKDNEILLRMDGFNVPSYKEIIEEYNKLK